MNNKNVGKMTRNALGIALYVTVSMLLQVRFIGNYFFHLGYVVMMVYLVNFGTLSGFFVGVIGVLLYCLLAASPNGLITWPVANALIAFICGSVFRKTKEMKDPLRFVIDIASILLATALGFLVSKPLLETLLFAQDFWVRATVSFSAFVMDTIVLVISYPIARRLVRLLNRR